jgi:hypothetical protein
MSKENNVKIYEWQCENCKKIVRAMYEKQLELNVKRHITFCKYKSKSDKDEENI